MHIYVINARKINQRLGKYRNQNGKEKIFTGMPTIVPTPETVRVNIERSVTLQCRAIGYPVPKITWRRNGVKIEKLSNRVKILPDGSLLINSMHSHFVVIFSAPAVYKFENFKITDVQVDDQDRYTCIAENTFGRQDKTIALLVTGLG